MWLKKRWKNRKRIKSRGEKRKQQVRKGKWENEEGEEGGAIEGRTRREEGEDRRKIGRGKNNQGCPKAQNFEMLMIFKHTFCLTSVISKRCL